MSEVDDLAAKIEADMIRNYGGEENISTDPASAIRGTIWARAIECAYLQLSSVVAGNQYDPKQVTDLIGKLEWEYKLYPRPSDDLAARRASVAAAAKLAGGPTRSNIEAILTALLGDAFIAYLTFPKEQVVEAYNPAAVGNWVAPGTPAFVASIAQNVLSGTHAVRYDYIGGRTAPLNVGETMLIDPGYTRPERLTVTAVAEQSFTATFTRPHAKGAVFTTARAPNAPTNKRLNLVVLTEAAAEDAETRRKVNLIMSRVLRATSSWSVVGETGGQAGPFTIGLSLLGVTAIGGTFVGTGPGGGAVSVPTDPSCTPTFHANATARTSASNLSSAPSFNANATARAAPSTLSSAPTFSAGLISRHATAAALSSAPTVTAGATGKSLAAGAPSSAPTFSAGLATLGQAALSSAPTLTANATGRSLAAAAPSSAPTLTGGATGAHSP